MKHKHTIFLLLLGWLIGLLLPPQALVSKVTKKV